MKTGRAAWPTGYPHRHWHPKRRLARPGGRFCRDQVTPDRTRRACATSQLPDIIRQVGARNFDQASIHATMQLDRVTVPYQHADTNRRASYQPNWSTWTDG
jgi:hypothetical protein